MIDKAIILNLKKDTHRRSLCENALIDYGWDTEKITFWECHDGLDIGKIINEPFVHFPNAKDRESPQTANVALAAIKDGFPFFKRLFNSLLEVVNIQMGTQFWNFCRILRHISENDEICLVSHDDIVLKWEYTKISNLVSQIVELENFRFLHLYWLPKKSENRIQQPTHIPNVYKSIQGPGDKSFIVSPEGACWLLEVVSEGRLYNFESIFNERRMSSESIPEGVFNLVDGQGGTVCNKDFKPLTELIDSNVLFYPSQEEIRSPGKTKVEYKTPVSETSATPFVDWENWNYYNIVLPKLKRWYADRG